MTHAGPLVQSRSEKAHTLLILIVVLLGSWAIWSTLVLPRLSPVEGVPHELRAIAARLLLWVLPAGIYLWQEYRGRALEPLRLNLPPTLRCWLVVALISAGTVFALSLDVAHKLDVSVGEVWRRWATNLAWSFPTAPLFEELVFRGVILAELLVVFGAESRGGARSAATGLRAWGANLAATAVFVGVHWPWWLRSHGLTEPLWANTLGVGLISLVLGLLFIYGRSLWPCIALHWLNNSLSALAP